MTDFHADSRTLRPSSLTTYAACARRWAAHNLSDDVGGAGYDLNRLPPVHVGAAVGSGVHAGAAYTMETKRTTGELGNETEAVDRAEAEFKSRMEFGVTWDKTTEGVDTGQRQIARMTKMYRHALAPDLQPLLVEHRLSADLGDGWTVSGQLDTLGGDPDADLRDIKTGVRMRANMVQYGAYAMLFRAHGYAVRQIFEDFLQRVSIKKEQPEPLSVEIDIDTGMQEAWETIQAIKRDVDEFRRRAADPNGRAPHMAFRANPSSDLCSAKFCKAWGSRFCSAHSIIKEKKP